MKKLGFVLLFALILTSQVYGQTTDGDIDNVRVIPDATKMKLAKIRINIIDKTATIVYREIDGNGDFTGVVEKRHYRNIPDDPSTPANEQDNQFNKMINEIIDEAIANVGLGDNQRKALKKAIKSAYQLP